MNFIIPYITFLPLQIQFSYRCYVNEFNVEPSNTNKYITGTLNKGQPLKREKGERRKGGSREKRKG